MPYFQRGYKYYYSTLTQDEMVCYNAILSGLLAFQRKITIPKFCSNHIFQIYLFILIDNPYLFYVENLGIASEYYIEDKTELSVTYLYEPAQVIDMITKADAKHSNFVASLANHDAMNKALAVHDYFLDNIQYDNASNLLSFTAIGPLLHGAGVCAGISYAAKIMFDQCGIDSVIAQGELFDLKTNYTEPHAWNLIKLNNSFFHFDITSDIGLSDHVKRYDYVGLSTEEIKKDHLIVTGLIDCPVSNNYYLHMGLTLKKKSDFERIINKTLCSGETNICFKIIADAEVEKIQDQLEIIIQNQLNVTRSNYSRFYIEPNATQKVFCVRFEK